MTGRLYRSLPGPLRVALMAIAVVVIAALLVLLFEWAGDLLDTGGTIGT